MVQLAPEARVPPQSEVSTLAAAVRSPWTVSEIDSITRSGVSLELLLVTVTVQSTRSPTLDRSVHCLSMAIPGWNRFTESEALALMSLVNPVGWDITVTVFGKGSVAFPGTV